MWATPWISSGSFMRSDHVETNSLTEASSGFSMRTVATSYSRSTSRTVPTRSSSDSNRLTTTESPESGASESSSTCHAVTNTPGTIWNAVPITLPLGARTRARYGWMCLGESVVTMPRFRAWHGSCK